MSEATRIIIWTILGSLMTIIIFLGFIRHLLKLYIKKYNEFETALNLKTLEKEKSILSTRIDVQEETIQKISKELHDNVNQILTLAKLNLNNIFFASKDQEAIDLTKELITNAINELSNMSSCLSSQSILDNGLLRTLEFEAERLGKISNTKIIVNRMISDNLIPYEEQLNLYRIFQEAIRNSIVHGNANEIVVSFFTCENCTYNLEISDNGIGFDLFEKKPNLDLHKHQGIKNMKRRSSIINSKFLIQSSINSGTKINVIKPLSPIN